MFLIGDMMGTIAETFSVLLGTLLLFRDIGEWHLTLHAMHGTHVVNQVLDEYTTNLETIRRVTLLADGSFRIQ